MQTTTNPTKILTLAEYRAFCDLPENADRLFELINGELVEKMGSFEPSIIAGEILFHIKTYLKGNPIGRITGADGTYSLDESTQMIPDVGYISRARLPNIPEREAPIPPDLAVEVKSPTDRNRALRSKAEQYIKLGTQQVWLIFPESQTVEIFLPGDVEVISLDIEGVIDGGTLLPGFQLPVRDIFAESPENDSAAQ